MPGDLSEGFSSQPIDQGQVGNQENSCLPVSENPAGMRYAVESALLLDQSSDMGVNEALYQMDDGADTTTDMSAFSAVPVTCGTFPGLIDNYPFTFTATTLLGFPKLGGQTAALTLSAVAQIGSIRLTVVVDLIQIQLDNTIISLNIGGGATETEVTTETLAAIEALAESAAHAAYAKVAALK